jgi:acyl-CoA synthetase (AMP-forming)/AMP-acid ligase II
LDVARGPRRLGARGERSVDRRVQVAAAGIGLVAEIQQFESCAEFSAYDLRVDFAVQVNPKEAVLTLKHLLGTANAALGELHRDDGGLRGIARLQALHQGGIARHLMITRDRAVDDAEGGIGALIRAVLLGNTLAFPTGRFDPGEAIELIARYRITRWNAVPTMATRLIDHPDIAKRDVSCLKTMTLGGAPVHAELLRRIHASLPGLNARIASGYGLSENAGQATAAGGAEIADRPGSSGRPLPLVEVKIVARNGLPDGEVLVRSPTQMLGYFGDDASPIDAEGWLHTGDLGRIDDRGSLWITGRSKDLIIRGGENIAPAAVERALIELPGVVDAAVIGVPHPDLGEEVAAFVVVSGDQTPEALKAGLRESIASFAVPSIWRLQSEPLPVNQTGKVDKPSLLARVSARERAFAR